MALCWQSSQTGSAWATRNILKRTRHMCFRKKIEVFHNKTGQSEIQVLYKILIKNWFYPSTWIYNMFPRWISYLSIIQTRNINETNKAFKNGTEAKMYVNTRWLWWKQGKQGKQPLSKVFTTGILNETVPRATVRVTIQIQASEFTTTQWCNWCFCSSGVAQAISYTDNSWYRSA